MRKVAEQRTCVAIQGVRSVIVRYRGRHCIKILASSYKLVPIVVSASSRRPPLGTVRYVTYLTHWERVRNVAQMIATADLERRSGTQNADLEHRSGTQWPWNAAMSII